MAIRDYVFFGKTFDEWEIGKEYYTSARTITETDIVNFAGLAGDWSATHVNDEYAKAGFYGKRIAYGNITFMVSTGMLQQTLMFEGTTIAMLDFKVSYQDPVFFQDTIFCKFFVEEKRKTSKGDGIIKVHVFVYNQDEKQVAEETFTFLVSNEKATMK